MEKFINIYPNGMLDRDQRTITTISLLHNKMDQLNPKNNFNLITFYKSDNSKNLIFNNHKFINLINNLKLNNNNKFKYKEFNSNKYENSTNIFLKNQYKLISLLVYFVILLSFIQSANAKPIQHHIMSSEDTVDNQLTNENNKKCQLIKNVLTIADYGLSTLFNGLNKYTRKSYNLDHLDHHREWIHHHNEALDPKEGRLKFENYNEPIPDQVFQHLYTTDISTGEKTINELQTINELLNIYERFKLILNGIQEIIKAKEADGNFNVEHDPYVMKFFKETEAIINELLQEIEMGLKSLHINIPEININIIENKNDGFDWIVIREYLKLLQYTCGAFKNFRDHCPKI